MYFGSDENRCRLTPSLVVLLQLAATHLDGIIENNKLQTWQKTLGNFFSSMQNSAYSGALHVYDAYLGKCCGSRIGNRLRLRHECYVNKGVCACRSAPPKFKMWYHVVCLLVVYPCHGQIIVFLFLQSFSTVVSIMSWSFMPLDLFSQPFCSSGNNCWSSMWLYRSSAMIPVRSLYIMGKYVIGR